MYWKHCGFIAYHPLQDVQLRMGTQQGEAVTQAGLCVREYIYIGGGLVMHVFRIWCIL